jgi:hypothetical protein
MDTEGTNALIVVLTAGEEDMTVVRLVDSIRDRTGNRIGELTGDSTKALAAAVNP